MSTTLPPAEIPPGQGLCPVCNGTGRAEADFEVGDSARQHGWYGFQADDGKITCRNCGGQTMYGKATGLTRLRADGTPCKHEYGGQRHPSWRCYNIYTCKHCGDRYDIDSSD